MKTALANFRKTNIHSCRAKGYTTVHEMLIARGALRCHFQCQFRYVLKGYILFFRWRKVWRVYRAEGVMRLMERGVVRL